MECLRRIGMIRSTMMEIAPDQPAVKPYADPSNAFDYFYSIRNCTLRQLVLLDPDLFATMAKDAVDCYLEDFDELLAAEPLIIMSYLDIYPFASILNEQRTLIRLCERLPDSIHIIHNLCCFLEITDEFIDALYPHFEEHFIICEIAEHADELFRDFSFLILELTRFYHNYNEKVVDMVNMSLPFDDDYIPFAAENLYKTRELNIGMLIAAYKNYENEQIHEIIEYTLENIEINPETYSNTLLVVVERFEFKDTWLLGSILAPLTRYDPQLVEHFVSIAVTLPPKILVRGLEFPSSASAILQYIFDLNVLHSEMCALELRAMMQAKAGLAIIHMLLRPSLVAPGRLFLQICMEYGVLSEHEEEIAQLALEQAPNPSDVDMPEGLRTQFLGNRASRSN